MEDCNAVDKEDVTVSGGDNIDMPAENKVSGREQDENISEHMHENDAMCRKRKRGDMTEL
jgi:hypothetical protein